MTTQPLFCNLDAIREDEQERHFGLVAQWQEAVEEVKELPAGYAFRLDENKVNILELAEFVSRERLCCPFFHFELAVEPHNGPLWLRLMGNAQVKTFVGEYVVGKD